MAFPPAGYYISSNGQFYNVDGSGPYMLDAGGNISQGFPKKFYTDSDGDYARLRVDTAQTSFFKGLGFRAFHRLNIAVGAHLSIKISIPVNTVLFDLHTDIKSGDLDMSTRFGMTETTPFVTPLATVFSINNMSTIAQPPYTRQNNLYADGVVTSGTGTEISVLLNKANNNINFASTIGVGQQDERGIAVGDYYFDLINLSATDAIVGALYLRWEERP